LKNPRASAVLNGISLFHARLTKTMRTFFFSCAKVARGCASIKKTSTPKQSGPKSGERVRSLIQVPSFPDVLALALCERLNGLSFEDV
jgi:hypothetical protein